MRYSLKPNLFGVQLFDRLLKRILAAAIVITCMLLILVVFLAAVAGNNKIDAVERALITESQLIASNSQEAFNLADYVAKQARSEWLETGKLRPHASQIEGMPNFRGVIAQIAIIDAAGYLSASSLTSAPSRMYLGDRAHFIALKDASVDKFYIGKPVVGRVSGKETVQFVRPIFSTDQKFSGVVVVSMDSSIFLAPEIEALTSVGTTVALLGEDNVKRFGSKPGTEPSSPESTFRTFTPSFISGAFGKLLPEHYFSRTSAISGFRLKLIVRKAPEEVVSQLLIIYFSTFLTCLAIIFAAFLFTSSIFRLIRSKQLLLLRLEASNLKANSANEMKSKFVSGISHELRTPLNGILGFSELAKLSGSFEESKRYNEVIFESAQRLHQLVNMLLDLAKIEAGQMQLTTTVVRTADFFESVVGLHRDAAEKKGLVLSLTVSQSAPLTMLVDRIKLMQVIDNLVGNAVKFTESGVIFLDVEKLDKSWVVKVVDTGIGMTQEKILHAFERFGSMQLYDLAVVPNQGAGLGLSLCKELLDLMAGAINIQSELNVGTTLTVTFKDTDV
jgi:two-component system sensor histidine kinase BarA